MSVYLSNVCPYCMVTVIHPRAGTGSTPGQWNSLALEFPVLDKWNRHGNNYAVISFAFAPCVATTYRHLHAHLLLLLYILARRQAELVHTHDKPLVDFEFLFWISVVLHTNQGSDWSCFGARYGAMGIGNLHHRS